MKTRPFLYHDLIQRMQLLYPHFGYKLIDNTLFNLFCNHCVVLRNAVVSKQSHQTSCLCYLLTPVFVGHTTFLHALRIYGFKILSDYSYWFILNSFNFSFINFTHKILKS